MQGSYDARQSANKEKVGRHTAISTKYPLIACFAWGEPNTRPNSTPRPFSRFDGREEFSRGIELRVKISTRGIENKLFVMLSSCVGRREGRPAIIFICPSD